MADAEGRVRIDKWLWAARFFKSRSLAAEAIDGGKVKLNGERPKTSKTINPGDRLHVRVAMVEYELEVLALAQRRGSASQAQLLYVESEQSRPRREEIALQLKLQPPIAAQQKGRPTKRDRRKLSRVWVSVDQDS
jgi:ribosome-associated heat shock protein Hsp15